MIQVNGDVGAFFEKNGPEKPSDNTKMEKSLVGVHMQTVFEDGSLTSGNPKSVHVATNLLSHKRRRVSWADEEGGDLVASRKKQLRTTIKNSSFYGDNIWDTVKEKHEYQVGIFYHHATEEWRAAIGTGCRRHQMVFAAQKYGYETARDLAILHRQLFENSEHNSALIDLDHSNIRHSRPKIAMECCKVDSITTTPAQLTETLNPERAGVPFFTREPESSTALNNRQSFFPLIVQEDPVPTSTAFLYGLPVDGVTGTDRTSTSISSISSEDSLAKSKLPLEYSTTRKSSEGALNRYHWDQFVRDVDQLIDAQTQISEKSATVRGSPYSEDVACNSILQLLQKDPVGPEGSYILEIINVLSLQQTLQVLEIALDLLAGHQQTGMLSDASIFLSKVCTELLVALNRNSDQQSKVVGPHDRSSSPRQVKQELA